LSTADSLHNFENAVARTGFAVYVLPLAAQDAAGLFPGGWKDVTMGHSLSADRRERQNTKRRFRNRGNAIALKRELKSIDAAARSGSMDLKEALSKTYSALDRAARKNTIPKGRADRRKARLAAALAKVVAGGSAAAPSAVARSSAG
jgi:small subunit ribosomal protein S20